MFGQSRKQAIWQFYSAVIGPPILYRALIGCASCRVPSHFWKFTLGWCSLTTVDLTLAAHNCPVLSHRHHSHAPSQADLSSSPLHIMNAGHWHQASHMGGESEADTPSNKAQGFIYLFCWSSSFHNHDVMLWYCCISPSWSNKNAVQYALSGSRHWYWFCKTINILKTRWSQHTWRLLPCLLSTRRI